MEIISKSRAKKLGLKKYFTGNPCRYGHISERLVRYNATKNESCCGCRSGHLLERALDLRLRWRLIKLKEGLEARVSERHKKELALLSEAKRKEKMVASFVRSSLSRIESNWKGGRSEAELDCGFSYDELVVRIESKFKDGMSWKNRSEWHIDHINPVSAFLGEGVTDPKVINALDNLQPLWAKENLMKGAKWE